MITIKDYELSLKDKKYEIIIDVIVDDIHWTNDSIGWFEYWGNLQYDYQPDYIENFNIIDIYYKKEKIRNSHKKLFHLLTDVLYKDENFKKEIEEITKPSIYN